MKVGVIDLGINNLSSVKRAFSAPLNQADTLTIITKGEGIARPDLIILPGLGNFGAGMSSLAKNNLLGTLRDWNEAGSRIIGICLGMQLLGKTSEESPGIQGLSLIPAAVEKLVSDSERIPHVGWAASKSKVPQRGFKSFSSNGDFYFVHSFHLRPENEEHILCQTVFGENKFVSGVISGGIIGLQFHPEKSGGKGKALISELIEWARDEG
jgi:imidazole glycerol phosphate synthase glutamine amidotransferase subunit